MDIENHYNNTPITHATLFGKQDTDVEEVTQKNIPKVLCQKMKYWIPLKKWEKK